MTEIREEKLFIGTKEEIQEYLRTHYGIRDRRPGFEADYFWLDNLNFDQQISTFVNGFGCLFFIQKVAYDLNDVPQIEFKMKKLNLWVRDPEWTEEGELEKNKLYDLAKEIRDISGRNILTDITLED